MTQSYDTSAVLPLLLLAENRQNSGRSFRDNTIFLPFLVCQISFPNFLLERKFKASAQV